MQEEVLRMYHPCTMDIICVSVVTITMYISIAVSSFIDFHLHHSASVDKYEIERDSTYRCNKKKEKAKANMEGGQNYFSYPCRLGRGVALTLSTGYFRRVRLHHFFVHKRLSSMASSVGLGLYGIGFAVCIYTPVLWFQLEKDC